MNNVTARGPSQLVGEGCLYMERKMPKCITKNKIWRSVWEAVAPQSAQTRMELAVAPSLAAAPSTGGVKWSRDPLGWPLDHPSGPSVLPVGSSRIALHRTTVGNGWKSTTGSNTYLAVVFKTSADIFSLPAEVPAWSMAQSDDVCGCLVASTVCLQFHHRFQFSRPTTCRIPVGVSAAGGVYGFAIIRIQFTRPTTSSNSGWGGGVSLLTRIPASPASAMVMRRVDSWARLRRTRCGATECLQWLRLLLGCCSTCRGWAHPLCRLLLSFVVAGWQHQCPLASNVTHWRVGHWRRRGSGSWLLVSALVVHGTGKTRAERRR
jgi:hypothetical protein